MTQLFLHTVFGRDYGARHRNSKTPLGGAGPCTPAKPGKIITGLMIIPYLAPFRNGIFCRRGIVCPAQASERGLREQPRGHEP